MFMGSQFKVKKLGRGSRSMNKTQNKYTRIGIEKLRGLITVFDTLLANYI
jgi:hypothetical protein